MQRMSIISAVRMTWGLIKSGEQHGLILDKGQHIAHHVAAAGRVDIVVQEIHAADDLGMEKFGNS